MGVCFLNSSLLPQVGVAQKVVISSVDGIMLYKVKADGRKREPKYISCDNLYSF